MTKEEKETKLLKKIIKIEFDLKHTVFPTYEFKTKKDAERKLERLMKKLDELG